MSKVQDNSLDNVSNLEYALFDLGKVFCTEKHPHGSGFFEVSIGNVTTSYKLNDLIVLLLLLFPSL